MKYQKLILNNELKLNEKLYIRPTVPPPNLHIRDTTHEIIEKATLLQINSVSNHVWVNTLETIDWYNWGQNRGSEFRGKFVKNVFYERGSRDILIKYYFK